MGISKKEKNLFYEAYKLAERLNKSKSYMESHVYPETEKMGGVKGIDLKRMLIDKRTIEIGGCLIDVIDGGFSKEYLDFNINCLTGTDGLNTSGKLTIRRYYNSNSKKIFGLQKYKTNDCGLLGYNWALNYETYCKYSENTITVFEINGQYNVFKRQGDMWVNCNEGAITKLVREDIGRKELVVKKLNMFYTYSFDGRLKMISDKNKNSIELRYINGTCLIQKIISSCGKSLDLKYRDERITEITDNIGRSTRYAYENGFLSLVENAGGGKDKLLYDKAYKKLSSVVDALGNMTFFSEFDRYGKPIKFYKGKNSFWYVSLDERSKTTSFSAEDTIAFKYDRTEAVREIKLNNDVKLAYEYDSVGNITVKSDFEGFKVTYEYDEYNRIRYCSFKDGSWEQFEYNADNVVFKTMKSNGYEKIIDYDARGNLIQTKEKVSKGQISVRQYEYDARGRIVRQTDANKNSVRFIYKSDNSIFPEIIIYPNGFEKEREYDEAGRLTAETCFGNTTRFMYNNNDLIIQTTFPNGLHDFKRYDYMGNLKDVILPKEVALSNEKNCVARKYSCFYDDSNNLISMTAPSGRTVASDKAYDDVTIQDDIYCEYDYLNNILKKSKPPDHTVTYSYDKNLNVVCEAISDKDFYELKTYEYDNRNNLIHFHSNKGQDKRYFYVGVDRLSKERIRIGKDDELQIVYKYDEMGLLNERIEITERLDIKDSTYFEYDENFNLLKIILPTGSRLTIDYDEDGLPVYTSENNFLCERC